MAQYSQNGYRANNRLLIGTYLVPGTSTRLAIRRGDVATVLCKVASLFDSDVEDIDTPTSSGFSPSRLSAQGASPSRVRDDWGFAVRNIRGSTTTLSNHASGSAIDLNSSQHPRGVHGTFTSGQVAAIRRILAYCEGAVRWGGDYREAPVDGMHFEIVGTSAQVARVARKIRAEEATARAAKVAAVRAAAVARARAAAALIAANKRRAAVAAAALAAAIAAYVSVHGVQPPPDWVPPTPTPTVTVSRPVSTPSPTSGPKVVHRPAGPVVRPPVLVLHRVIVFRRGHRRMTGSDVRAVQRLVGARPDGSFGPSAAAAVARWQRSHGITPDGRFGRSSALRAGWRFV